MIKSKPLADITAELTAVRLSSSVINGIKVDMRNGWVPVSVLTFAELHNHVDANEYLITALERAEIMHDPSSEAQAEILNRTMDIVNVWLAAR